jgi:GxxExxY protein
MLKVKSDLPIETEDLATRVIGCCIDVHRALGPGLLEKIYARAVCTELDHAGVQHQREREIPVTYRGELLCQQRLDIVVADQIILEIKSVEHLNPIHRAQLTTYLRISRIRLGLLLNFNVAILQDGIKRVAL